MDSTKNGLSSKTERNSRQQCEHCGKNFRKPCLLRRHAVVHMKSVPFECSTCKKRFSQKSSLQRHEAHNHLGIKKHQCSECELRFAQRSNLLQHLRRAHSTLSDNNGNSYACTECTCTFSKLNILNRHKSARHANHKGIEHHEFQEDVPVEDPGALAQHVLVELKRLQSGMQLTQEEKHEPKQKDKQLECTPPQNQPLSTNTELTVVDVPEAVHLITLNDKLNPERQVQRLQVQCVRRAGDKLCTYLCEFCAKEFTTVYSFLRHRRCHTKERPYKCNYCESSFSIKNKLQRHLQVHVLDDKLGVIRKQHTCVICQQSYDSLRQLETHVRTHPDSHKVNFICSYCQATMSTQSALRKHKCPTAKDKDLRLLEQLLLEPIDLRADRQQVNVSNQQAEPKYTFPCKHCGLNFDCRAELARHKQDHTRLRTHLCGICGRCYSSKSALLVHLNIHAGRRRYTCPHCPTLTYNTKAQRERHILFRHTQQQRNFKCPYCEGCFKTKHNCKQHICTHLHKLLNAGSECQSSTNNIGDRTAEAAQCFAPTEEHSTRAPSKCNFVELQLLTTCSQQNPRNFTIELMSKTSINTEDAANCSQPSDTSTSRNKCHLCGKPFKKPIDLRRHVRTHLQERPYSCTQCDRKFSLNSTLQDHLLTHQHNRPKLACQVCGKAYASKKVLTIHLRLHTGERPFSCEHCGKTFRTSGHRISHMKAAKHAKEHIEINEMQLLCN